MTTLDLPAMPVNADHEAFVAECHTAISILTTMETNTTADLANAEAKSLTKAAAALKSQLPAIRLRKKEIGVAKNDAIIAAQNAVAAKWDKSAAALRPRVETAQAAFDAAQTELTAANEALRWHESRADLARSDVKAAELERARFGPEPASYRPASQPGHMERTVDEELALIGRR